MGNKVEITLKRSVLSRMVAEAILEGAQASAEIEGEGDSELKFTRPPVLPEVLLRTS
jgi:hypothetical protein